MDIALFWSMFVILGITYFVIAINASGHVKNEKEFFFANKSLGLAVVTATLLATQIGGGFFLGTAKESFDYGTYGLAYNLGICSGFLLLGLGLAPKLRRLGINTNAEIFSLKSGSIKLRRIASVLSILTLGGLLTTQIIASRKLFFIISQTSEMKWVLIAFWLLVITYTMIGGLKAVIATDIFQLIITVVVTSGLLLYFFASTHHPITYGEFINEIQTGTKFSIANKNHLISLFILPLCYSLISQDLGQRFLSASSPNIARFAAILAAFFALLISFVPFIFGAYAKIISVDMSKNNDVFLSFASANTDHFFYYLAVCAIIAALSSTADSLLCAISSNIMEDFCLTDKKVYFETNIALVLSRIITFLIGITALIIAYQLDDIMYALAFSYEISVSCLFVPFFCAYFLQKPNAFALAAAMCFGALSFFIFRLHPIFLPKEIMSLLFSFVGFLLGQFYKTSKKI